MHYDVVIIGAGMSGLAAGIRLAHFERSVCIVEKHYAYGGLNSYYKLDGREFDVGLHAVTNYVPPGNPAAPLSKLLRQLRLTRDDFGLLEQTHSEIRFPQHRLRFSNGIDLLIDNVAASFPKEADGFRRLVADIEAYDDTRLDRKYAPTRPALAEYLRDPILVDMILCPLMYYGSATEHDMDFTQFVTMFKSIFCQGFARPREGVRRIIKTLVRRYRSCGGKIKMRCGVEHLNVTDGRVASLDLENGETITADTVLSSIGYVETLNLCAGAGEPSPSCPVGEISFVETIAVLDVLPSELGHSPAIVFFNEADRFTYAKPSELVDTRSGVICCPSNYKGHGDMAEGIYRVTWLANPHGWMNLAEADYREAKAGCKRSFLRQASESIGRFADHVVATDMFTPRTIRRYTGHINGAVYGSPQKHRDGRTPYENLFICGTDQGFLGIIGAMLSGITIANLQVLSRG